MNLIVEIADLIILHALPATHLLDGISTPAQALAKTLLLLLQERGLILVLARYNLVKTQAAPSAALPESSVVYATTQARTTLIQQATPVYMYLLYRTASESTKPPIYMHHASM